MDDVRALCEMYGLSDMTEESFNMLESAAAETMLPASAFTAPRSVYSTERELSSFCPLLSPSSLPTFAASDQLAYPDYMMVYTQSGLPVRPMDNLSFVQNITRHTGTYSGSRISQSETKFPAMHPEGAYFADNTTQSSDFASPKSGNAPRRGRPPKNAPLPDVAHPGKGCISQKTKEKENFPFAKVRKGNHQHSPVLIGAGKDVDGPDEDYNDETEELENDLTEFHNDEEEHQAYPKPPYSYSALVTIALKNSKNGRMTVRDIYNFMCKHYPYFRTASAGWKNSVRHNLSLNPGFLKIFTESGPAKARTACRWTVNPDRYTKLNEDILKWHAKSLEVIKRSMKTPELLNVLEKGSGIDFRQAIQGVTIQKKNLGNGRRKSSKSSLTGSEITENPDSPFMACIDDFLESANLGGNSGSGHNMNIVSKEKVKEPAATSYSRNYDEAAWNNPSGESSRSSWKSCTEGTGKSVYLPSE